jgi:hypothetical protein
MSRNQSWLFVISMGAITFVDALVASVGTILTPSIGPYSYSRVQGKLCTTLQSQDVL